MLRTTLIAAITAIALLPSISALAATGTTTTFSSSRAELRTDCAAIGGDIVEGWRKTQCFSEARGFLVTCNDGGVCRKEAWAPTKTPAAGGSLIDRTPGLFWPDEQPDDQPGDGQTTG